ncbi:hypothetical protein [Epilithonimonas hominis]|uniref:Uncharacterized protein n=1 Tax=Epilithonimonas hominis TaxID=420404 RepID=A0A1H6HWQ8_9FLAO|nr:hypothetical protein [Epilithonimonas hominis]SEH39499.1 hypothetical protein SAMN05421793_102113 [Epilithonimonas hominis]
MEAKQIPGVPVQKKGAFHDTESKRSFESEELVANHFEILKNRFFSINRWKEYGGDLSADFRLFDCVGSYVERMPRKGDYIRIDIPGPGDIKAKGYDWVEVMKIDDRCYGDELERYLLVCRPSAVPQSNEEHIAHFYARESSSSFIISRGIDYIKAGIYGRNEVPNISRTGFFGRIRNLLVSIGGFFQLTKIQWKSLADGFLDF